MWFWWRLPISGGVEVDFTDGYSNCSDFDPYDNIWFKEFEIESLLRESTSSEIKFYVDKIASNPSTSELSNLPGSNNIKSSYEI